MASPRTGLGPAAGAARGRKSSVFPQDADDAALNLHILPRDDERLQFRIGRLQTDFSARFAVEAGGKIRLRSEEHTSELQSRLHLVCRLLLEKKKKTK